MKIVKIAIGAAVLGLGACSLFRSTPVAPPPASSHSLAKMVCATGAPEDPERTRLLARLLGADGTSEAVRATTALERARAIALLPYTTETH